MSHEGSTATIVNAGDLLYVVGQDTAPFGATPKWRIYSTVVKSVWLDIPAATTVIELGHDRPTTRGFSKWSYRGYDVGISIFRSAADALRAFATQAQQRRDAAERARIQAETEIRWAGEQLALRG
jgi:hypothetical protein